MEYIIGLLFLAAAFFAIYKIKMFGAKGISKHWFSTAFAFKVVLAIIMYIMYTQNTTSKNKADIFRYYNDSKVISTTIITHPILYLKLISGIDNSSPELNSYYQRMNNWEYSEGSKLFSNNRLLIRYLSLINIFTFNSYYADVVISIFLAFMGLFWIFRFFNYHVKNRKWLIFALVFYFPSIAFWTSGILKESLLLFSIGLLFNCGNYALRKRKSIARSFMVIIALLIIYNLKAFVFFILLPPLMAYLWNQFKPNKRAVIPYFILFFIAFSFASESGKIMKPSIFDLLVDKQLSFIELANSEDANSTIKPILFSPNSTSILINSPIALTNSLFRPMPWEANNIRMIFNAVENIVLLLIILLIVIFPTNSIDNKNVFWLSFSFSISFLIIIGLSTPIMGAISRYRVPALLLLLMSLVQLINTERIKQIIYPSKKNKTNV